MAWCMAHDWLGDGPLRAVITGCNVVSSAVEAQRVLCAGSPVIFEATVFTLFLSLVWSDVGLMSLLVDCVTDYKYGAYKRETW